MKKVKFFNFNLPLLRRGLGGGLLLLVVAVFTTCTKDEGGSGDLPAKAVITGAAANECPATTVVLTASAAGAQSYLWYRNTFVIADATASTYAAISSGTYYVVGVSAAGKGERSDDKEVNIQLNCPPSVPALSGETSNLCPALTVRLTATAENVESYIWYKDATVIPGATTDFYDVRENGVYAVAAKNSYGTSGKSVEKTVTFTACPPAPPVISGANYNVCPVTTVVLTATSDGADSYQWYLGDKKIDGATASTYEVTVTGAYYATATNALGTSEKTANAYIAYVELCAGNYEYADLLGTYNAAGTPCMWGGEDTPGAPTWTTTLSQPAGTATTEYMIKPFSGAWADTKENLLPVYLEVGYNEGGTTVGFAINTLRELGKETVTDKTTGLPKTYTAYFQAFFTRTITNAEGKSQREIHWFSDQFYRVFWDSATKTLDFSGVYNYEGTDYDVIVAIIASTDIENKKWEGSFSDGYKYCKFVQPGAPGTPAAAFTGERVSLPRVNSRKGESLPIVSVTTTFDPAKFSRK
jgi:hypothetical protein